MLDDDGFVQEAEDEHFPRIFEADAPTLQVEQGVRIEAAGGGAVRALHVVGVDFKARHALRAGVVVQEDVAAVLARVGFLRAVSDVDCAVEVALGVVVQRAAHDLVAFAVFGVVAHVEVVVGDLVAAQVLDAAEGEVAAFAAQFAMHVETVQAAARLQGVDADAAVGGLGARDVHELGGVFGAMKPQGEVELRAFGGVNTEDRQLCSGAACLVVNPAGGAAVFAEAQVDAAVLQSRCGKVDVEHERGVKRGVFGHGE